MYDDERGASFQRCQGGCVQRDRAGVLESCTAGRDPYIVGGVDAGVTSHRQRGPGHAIRGSTLKGIDDALAVGIRIGSRAHSRPVDVDVSNVRVGLADPGGGEPANALGDGDLVTRQLKHQ